MRIAQIAVLFINTADDFGGSGIVAAGGPELRLNLFQQLGGDGVNALGGQLLHKPGYQLRVPAEQVQQPLQVGGHQNVHGGGGGLEQGTAAVIGAGADEIREHIVGIGGADEGAHRQTQPLCQVSRQNVAKVAGRNGEVHLIAQTDFSRIQQIPVGAEIVHDLGSQPADVDGVGTGQSHGQVTSLAGGEDVLHPGLGIVEVAPDGADGNVLAFLGHHLCPLNLGYAAVGIEHADTDAGHIPEAFQSGLAGVAGGGGENQDVLFLTLDGLGGGEQLGQHGKRHVLKGGGGPPEQLQHGETAHWHGGSQVFRLEFSGVGPAHQLRHIGDIRQQSGENLGGHLDGAALQAFLPIKGRQTFGHIQTAVGSQSLQDGLGAVNEDAFVSGRMIPHWLTS